MTDNDTTIKTPPVLTAKDFASDQEAKWCPGCGENLSGNSDVSKQFNLLNNQEAYYD